MHKRRSTRLVIAATAALSVLLAFAGTAPATHRGQDLPDEVDLQLSYQEAALSAAHGHVIARAVIDDGSPAAGATIEFLREVDFLGPRLISMGKAQTDAYGTARVTIDTDAPVVRVHARITGDQHFAPVEVVSEINQPAGRPKTGADPLGSEPSLAFFAAVMPPLLAAIALAIWVSLLGVSAATVIGIRRERRDAHSTAKGGN